MDTMKRFIEAGADPNAKDEEFDSTLGGQMGPKRGGGAFAGKVRKDQPARRSAMGDTAGMGTQERAQGNRADAEGSGGDGLIRVVHASNPPPGGRGTSWLQIAAFFNPAPR